MKILNFKICAFLAALIFSGSLLQAQSYSFTFKSAEDGLFGLYGGYVFSYLNQPMSEFFPDGKRTYQQGWEAGIKIEMWRGLYVRGNATLSYQQTGAIEYFGTEAGSDPMEIDLQSVRLSVNPLVFKTPGDFFHLYGGGGFYGSYIFKQDITNPHEDFILNDEGMMGDKDLGVNILGGVNLYNIELEIQVGFGLVNLAERLDGSPAKQRFASVSLAYMFDRDRTTTKSCKDKRRLTRVTKRDSSRKKTRKRK